MIHRYTLLLSTVLATKLAAQSPFELADQRTHEVVYNSCARAGNVWVVGGGAGPALGGTMSYFLQGVHADGTSAWGMPHAVIPLDMRSMPDGRALIAGPVDWCDIPAPTSMLTLVDSSGSVVWTKEYYVEWATRMDVADDGRILLAGYNAGLITDQNGDSLTSFTLDTLGSPGVRWAVWESDSTVMILRYGDQFERRTLQAGLLASTPWVGDIHDAISWNGLRLALDQAGFVHRLDDELAIISTTPLGDTYVKGRFVRGDSTLWAVGSEQAAELDNALNVLQVVELDPVDLFNGLPFLGFAVDGDTIAMAGSAITASHWAGILRTVIADGTVPSHDENVSIALQSIDSAWCSGSGSMGYPRANVTVQVTNEGSGVIDSLVVSHTSFGWMCASVGTYLHRNDLSLAPGATVTAELTGLWLDDSPCGWVDLDLEVCIAALSPNVIYDRDQSDNLACDTAHIVLGLKELSSAPLFALVHDASGEALELRFFSPTTNDLRLRLLDASGRTHEAALIPRGSMLHRISTTGLGSGLHVAQVCDAGRGCWAVKWVKE